ncbi:MAG: zinc ribbon domain-containing protein [Armatimonadetes bacterium]|nr:zinc ribbon domain-containing protein [Armatimonadota bacterium]
MPLYDYRCSQCKKRFTQLVGMTADSKPPECPTCGSSEVRKLISRFARIKSDDERLDDFENAALAAEDNPRAMRRLMREMGKELGENGDEDLEELIEEAEEEMENEGLDDYD